MKIRLILILSISIAYSGVNFQYNGKFSHFYAIRNSTNKVLNIPFRMLELNSTLQLGKNFEIKTLLSTEYHNTNDDYFNSKNISYEIRELYGTYYFNSGEISFGKKLFTLGSVDESSPIDHFNPYNYYYLLMGGTDKKIGVNSLSFEFYLGDNYKISAALSPEHNTNYYPQNDSEYELGLSIYPGWEQFLDNKGNQYETFLSIQRSSNNNELTLTYLRAFDRVFSLSGFTMHEFTGYDQEYIQTGDGDGSQTDPDHWFTHRLTEALNLGNVFLFNDFTIRYDLAYFHTFDRYNRNDYSKLSSQHDLTADTSSEYYTGVEYYFINNNIDIIGDSDPDYFTMALQEDAEYTQFTFQIEIPFENDYQLNMQYFYYHLNKYSILDYKIKGATIIIANYNIDLNDILSDTGDFFNPGVGSSMATLTKQSILISLEKYLLDNNLKISFSSFFDLDEGNGKLSSIELEYEVSDNINIIFGSTKITGDKSVQPASDFDLGYTFNLMEDFSHNRVQLNYYF